MGKYSEDRYLDELSNIGPFDGKLVLWPSKMVKTRKVKECLMGEVPHKIPKGSKCKVDKGIVDDIWCTQYSCERCMDLFIDYCIEDKINHEEYLSQSHRVAEEENAKVVEVANA